MFIRRKRWQETVWMLKDSLKWQNWTIIVGINVVRGHVFAFKKKANSSFKNNETKIAAVLWCCRRYGQHYCCHTQDCKQRKIYKNDNEALCKWKRFPSCRAKESNNLVMSCSFSSSFLRIAKKNCLLVSFCFVRGGALTVLCLED